MSNEKLHLDNARKLRGISFIDPRIRNSRRPSRMFARNWKQSGSCYALQNYKKNCGSGGSDKNKTKLACILEANESVFWKLMNPKKLRIGESLPIHHEDHIAGKGNNSLQHYNLVHKFIPMSQAIKIPAAKEAVDKEWEKSEKFSAWNLTKVKSKKQVIDEARTKGVKVYFVSVIGHMSFEECRIVDKSTKNTKVELYSEGTF